jgi:RNA polymerase sigma-70 factor (ECF subfamily)
MMNDQTKDEITADEQLVTRFIAGDERAFDVIVQRYYRQIFGFLARFTGDRDLAEDLTQETFIKVHKSAKTFDPARSFKPWLFSVAANKARDALRSVKRSLKTVDIHANQSDRDTSLIDIIAGDHEPPDKRMIEQERAEKVKHALSEMAENLREVLVLAYYERLQYKEIADMLAIPLGTVKSRLHKAVLTFGEIWKAMEDEHRTPE